MDELKPLSLRWLPVAALLSGLCGVIFYSISRSLWSTVPGVGLALTLTFLMSDRLSGSGRLHVLRAVAYGGAGAVGTAIAMIIVH